MSNIISFDEYRKQRAVDKIKKNIKDRYDEIMWIEGIFYSSTKLSQFEDLAEKITRDRIQTSEDLCSLKK